MHHVNKRDVGTLPPGSSVFPIYSEFFATFPSIVNIGNIGNLGNTCDIGKERLTNG